MKPMPIKPESTSRILAALTALNAYERQAGMSMRTRSSDMDDMITYLLTDLRHYCAVSGEDFEKHVRRSSEHFNAESAP